MTEFDFYQQRILGGGVFTGNVLIQAKGEIGGSRNVFVKLQSSAKNGLVYPTTGGVLKNPFKGRAKIYAGDLLEYNPGIEVDGGATVKVLKTYEVAKAASTTEVLIKRDGFRHIPFVGDILMVAQSTVSGTGTGVTVTAVESTTDSAEGDVWKLTVSAAVTAAKGAILVEADKAGAGAKGVVTNPNCYAPCDYDCNFTPASATDKFDGARYMLTPCLANDSTVLYKAKMSPIPEGVLALNRSKVQGWFSL